MAEKEIAALARRMADKLANLSDDVVQSYEFDDPEKQVRQLRAITNEIQVGMVPVYSWQEMRNPAAADRLSQRLRNICKEALACASLTRNKPRRGDLPVMAHATSEYIRILADQIEAAGGTGGGKISDSAVSEADKPDGMPWQVAGDLMLNMMKLGKPFTSQQKLADQLGCSSFTINKAIKNTPDLSEWSKKQRASATGMQSLQRVADSIPQKRETDPSQNLELEDDDIDAAMRFLMEKAGPDERAGINAMDPADRRQLADTAYRDADTAEQLWRERQPKPSDD